MRTIKPLTAMEIAMLRAEQQVAIRTPTGLVLLPQRIVDRIIRHECGCWTVQGWGTGKGHANMKVNNRTCKVHRVVYTLLIGDIPDALPILDHKASVGCQFKNCCFPWHLEPVTNGINTERGGSSPYRRNHEYA